MTKLKAILDSRVEKYNFVEFIDSDPIRIPHRFSLKEDIEISGFLTATISWGNRKSILTNAGRMCDLMDNAPFDFVMNHHPSDLQRFESFVHRTFQPEDMQYFIYALKEIYGRFGSLERAFIDGYGNEKNLKNALINFHALFFNFSHMKRTEKHVSNPAKGASAKRLNMFLRWMVRRDNKGVDFGIWKQLSPSVLSCPLDVHSGNQARALGLLTRKQNDWKAVEELDSALRVFDPEDPVKYDYALFGEAVSKPTQLKGA
jgi:uncharacterized protein (TIGR02757 family)